MVGIGLGGLALGWTERRRTLSHERTLLDLQAVRTVLEDGAIHLHDVSYTLDEVKWQVRSGAPDARRKLRAEGRRFDELCERMKIRLGSDHDVTSHFVAADHAALAVFRALEQIALALPAENQRLTRVAIDLIDAHDAHVTAALLLFCEHREKYIATACATAGVRLPTAAQTVGLHPLTGWRRRRPSAS